MPTERDLTPAEIAALAASLPGLIESFRGLPLTVSEAEAGRMIGCSARTVFTLAADGKLPVLRIGASKRYPIAGILDYIDTAEKLA